MAINHFLLLVDFLVHLSTSKNNVLECVIEINKYTSFIKLISVKELNTTGNVIENFFYLLIWNS